MKTANRIAHLVLLSSLSCSVYASDFNYQYGQIDYLMGDFEGFAVKGSFNITDQIFAIAGYTGASDDEAGFDIDYTQLNIGAGYHMPINQQTDAVFTVSIVDAEVEIPDTVILGIPIPGYTEDDTGVLLTAGVRFNVSPEVELAGGIHHISTFDGDTGIHAEARYHFKPNMSGGIGFSTDDYNDGLSINFRMGF